MPSKRISNIIAKNSDVVLLRIQSIPEKSAYDTNDEKTFYDVKSEEIQKEESTNFRNLYRFFSPIDLLYFSLASLAAGVLGLTLPLSMVIFGESIDAFIDSTTSLCSLNYTSLTEMYCPPEIVLTSSNFYSTLSICNITGISVDTNARIHKQIVYSVIIGCVAFLGGYIRTVGFNSLADRQSRIIRHRFFRSILQKDVYFFDQHKTGELSTCLTDDINKIANGIGDKLGTVIEIGSTFISCLVIGFIKGWKLTLVVLSMLPIVFLAIIISSRIIGKMVSKELKAYGKAGAVAEEVISSIRTVLCYNGQERETHRYEQHLDVAKKSGMKKSLVDGIANGLLLCLIYSIFALGFWYGAKLVREDNYSIGNVFTIFMGIYMGVLCLEQASPFFQAVIQAREAISIVLSIIDEPSTIKNTLDKGLKKEHLTGSIQFCNVHFSYPTRSNVPILDGVSFNVDHGQTIALVGASGSGKSTCIQLLQRFYDYQSGAILLDGVKVNDYNLQWLRQHIGVVSQEPILFQTTIRENILFGCQSATDEQIYEAAKMANAHNFIMSLPDKYETHVGERGVTLSGGQKQRIAIARALIRNPKILLLDEATSALDNESEKLVQEALDRAAQGRTTIIIAHRLSTIRHANKIIVLQKGEVVEEGDHDLLMKMHGVYFGLVEHQQLQQVEEIEAMQIEKPESILTSSARYDLNKKRRSTLANIAASMLNTFHPKRKSIDEVQKRVDSNTTLSILKMNKPEWLLIVLGCVAALVNGALEPTSAIVQTKLVTAFEECDKDKQAKQVLLCSLIYIGFGICGFIVQSSQIFLFAWAGEALTKRLRSKTFRAILRQDVAFFDAPDHSSGTLCTYLATEASAVQGASGVRLGVLLQNFVTVGAGILIGFIYSWQLTLLIVGFLPLIIFGAVLQLRLTTRFEKKDKEHLENAGKIAMEAIQNIRTVMQLSKETYFYDQYTKCIDTVHRSSRKRIQMLSILYATTSAVFFFAMAALIALGAYLINRQMITFEDFFMVFDSIALTARIASQTLTLSPDYGKAIKAAENIFDLLNRKPLIDNESRKGRQISDFTGRIQFDDVTFHYPSRPETTVLKNFKLKINSGQKVALIGTSGCGKSTIIQLIERFYDLNGGVLLVDSEDIRNLDLYWYRSQIGLVSQEPILFDMSIRENIAYGDNSRENIPIEEIIQAAKSANVHDFIQLLPDRYETRCGAKGVQLSGGQKQRIAIARALIRNPKILLFDEATSALDTESEKIVQEALDRAQENRTSITIAHRLSTIQNADMICVLHNGVIVECGTHAELLALGDRYYRLALGRLH
ncbi:unnamed protein product [Adineta ricciae]|uniref:ABC-type xenobiotic transporter n=1 Tax=Adineta ricciae TaxID=249248 RepID=A0A814HP11_ADIRI|nr:unnamed protein product [Adineta ricciae]